MTAAGASPKMEQQIEQQTGQQTEQHTEQHHTEQHHTEQHHTEQHHTEQHHTEQHHTEQHHTEQQSDDMPEVTPQNFPEVAQRSQRAREQQLLQQQHFGSIIALPKDEPPHLGFGPMDGSTVYSEPSPYQRYVPPHREEKEQTICGCPTLVFILASIIAVLSMAVIGLAAGTGIEANRAADFQQKYAEASSIAAVAASRTTSTVIATVTSFNSLTNGCSDNADKANHTTYASFSLYGDATYTIYCNLDTPHDPLIGLFVPDFNSCMDSCSAWTTYVPGALHNKTAPSVTCAAVSYVPLWSDKAMALSGDAPGNCYLKAGPITGADLVSRYIGTEVHAAVVNV